jgi:hypothetical protein
MYRNAIRSGAPDAVTAPPASAAANRIGSSDSIAGKLKQVPSPRKKDRRPVTKEEECFMR